MAGNDTTIADAEGFSGFGERNEGDLDGWAKSLSRALPHSVLAIWTWDGESSVVATRWKKGTQRAQLTLLQEAYRGGDGKPRAPAKVLWPWLPPERRAAILRDGVALVEPTPAFTTGDAEIDELLGGFDDDHTDDDDGEHVYVPLETSVAPSLELEPDERWEDGEGSS